MYRHPPPRTCSGSKSGYNANLNCVCFNWTWNGWTCLYCEQMIGSAPDDLPSGFSQKEEAAALWYRARFARLSEWKRRVALGIETEDWDAGWEPTPLPKTIRTSAVSAPARMRPPPVPEPQHRFINPAIAHADAMNSMYVNLQMQMQAHYYPQQPIPAHHPPTPVPRAAQDDLSAYLATPGKVVLEMPPTPKLSKQEDIDAVEDHPSLARPSAQPRTSQVKREVAAPSSPPVDSPMEVEQTVQVASDGMDVDSSAQLSGSATPVTQALYSSPAASPLSDAPESPGIVISTLLPRDDCKEAAPQSPTSSAIAALLGSPDSEPERKPVTKGPKKKAPVARKKAPSSAPSTLPEAKARRGPKAPRPAGPDAGVKKGSKKDTKPVVLKIPASAVGGRASAAAKNVKTKSSLSSSAALATASASFKSTPPSSTIPLPGADAITSSPVAAAPAPKLWQSIKIPKKSSSFPPPTKDATTPRTLSASLPSCPPPAADNRGSKVRAALLPASRA